MEPAPIDLMIDLKAPGFTVGCSLFYSSMQIRTALHVKSKKVFVQTFQVCPICIDFITKAAPFAYGQVHDQTIRYAPVAGGQVVQYRSAGIFLMRAPYWEPCRVKIAEISLEATPVARQFGIACFINEGVE